jgi:hypothetical protein
MPSREQFGEIPQVIRDVRLHGGSDADALVQAAEVVKGEV